MNKYIIAFIFCYAPYFFLLFKGHEFLEIDTENLILILTGYEIILWAFLIGYVHHLNIKYLNNRNKINMLMVISTFTPLIMQSVLSISYFTSSDSDEKLIGHIGLFLCQSIFFASYIFYTYIAFARANQ